MSSRQHTLELQLGKTQQLKPQALECDLVEAMRTGIFISGTTGSGKSNLGLIIADLLMKNNIIVYVVDPSQVWRNSSVLRVLRMEYPMTVKWKDGTVAESTVFDVSFLTYPQRLEFVEKFCRTLLDARKKSTHRQATFVFFEEGQLYFSQGTMRSPKSFDSSVELVTNGRNFGVRYGVITQFPSSIDKLLIKITKQRYFGWTNEPNDIGYIEGIIGKEMAKELPNLDVGEFIYSYAGRNGGAMKVLVPLFEDMCSLEPRRRSAPIIAIREKSINK